MKPRRSVSACALRPRKVATRLRATDGSQLLRKIHKRHAIVIERAIREAIQFHIDGLRDDGAPVPPPTSRVDYIEVAA